MYDDAESEARSLRASALARSEDSTPLALAATDDLVRALVLNGKGHTDEARTLAGQVVRTREPSTGARPPDLGIALTNLGDVLASAGEFGAAIPLFERALSLPPETAQASSGPSWIPAALDGLGAALSSAGRHAEAIAALERSDRLKREADAGPFERIRTMELLARARQSLADYSQSGRLIDDATKALEDVPREHPVRVDVLNRRAQQLWFEGRLRESLSVSEDAVSMAARTLRSGHPTRARALRYLGGTLADLGNLARSREVRAQALAAVESEFGPDHAETGLYVNSVSMADLDLGAFPSARRGFERVRTIMEARLGPSHDFVATAYLNLALVNARLGDYAAAQREHRRATLIWEETLGRDHPFVALGLTELAAAYQEQGQPARALPLLQRALAIREKALGPDHRDVAATASDLAVVFSDLGQLARARMLADRAIQVLERQDMSDAPEFATALLTRGQLQLRTGEVEGSVQSHRAATAIRERTFGVEHPMVSDARAGLAVALTAAGELPAAVTLAAEAEVASREHLRLLLAELPERQSLNYAATRPRTLDLILSLWDRAPGAEVEGLEQVVRSRALVLDEVAARRLGGSTDSETAALSTSLSEARQRLANLLVRGPRSGAEAQHVQLLAAARDESEAAEQRLAERSAAFRRERRRTTIGLSEVRQALPPDAALVSFVRYRRTVPAASKTSARVVDSYLAFVLRPTGAPVPVRLGTAGRIDAAVTEWRATMIPGEPPESGGGGMNQHRALGAALRGLVWDPVATHLDGVRRVFIVTDGSLNLVPFAALPMGTRSYLVERGPTLHYLTAERDLAATFDTPVAAAGLLAVGGADFDRGRTLVQGSPAAARGSGDAAALRAAGGPCGDLRSVVFHPIAGTGREVRDLARVWRELSASDTTFGTVRTLVGDQASEPEVKAAAASFRILHVATHGFFLGHECAPVSGGTRGVGGLARSRPGVAANPLRLSGLALAGANRRSQARANEDDGILTAEEVAMLDLRRVEWAVLSACDTGVGEIKAGEGVFGLRRAFQVAGARTVIMSLWSIEDEATRAWMRALYEGRFRKKLSTADAVHHASLKALSDRRARGLSDHPFFWAAFVAAGDWR